MVLGDQTVTVEEHRLRELVSQGGGRADGRRDGQPHGDTHGRGRSSRGDFYIYSTESDNGYLERIVPSRGSKTHMMKGILI